MSMVLKKQNPYISIAISFRHIPGDIFVDKLAIFLKVWQDKEDVRLISLPQM